MTEEQPRKSNVVAVVVHPTELAFWIPDDGDPLLRFETDDALTAYDVEPLLRVVGERWGLQAIVLRCLEERSARDRCPQELLYLLTARTGVMPSSGRWQGIADLNIQHPSSDPGWDVFVDALHELSTPRPPTRRPWAERGWFDAADAWAVAALHATGAPPDQPAVQLRTWGLATVNRYRTSGGDVFFKATAYEGDQNDPSRRRSLLFANEAMLLSAFSARCPDYVPRPIAVDPDRVWSLLPDAGPPLGESKDIALWEKAIRVHARRQREMLGQASALQRMGCPNRSLSRLSSDIDDLVADSEAMAFLEPTDQERFLAAIPAIKALVAEIQTLGIPDSFTHGDLHPWNIGLQGDRLLFFDWTDACITHPFLDLASYLAASRVLKDVPDIRDRLKSAYLDEWHGLASAENLERSADLAEMVAMAHQAISYQHMIRSLEGPSRTDMGGGIPYWLTRLLERLA